MRPFTRALLAAVSFAAIFTGLAAPAAATTSVSTWTVTPGGIFGGGAAPFYPETWLIDTVTGAKFKCGELIFSGYLKRGTGLPPRIGRIGGFNISAPCTGKGLTLTTTPAGLPWGMRAAQYDPATGAASGTILGVELTITSSTCAANLTGRLLWSHAGLYTTFTAPRTLTIANVTGCAGVISDGDAFTFYAHEYSKKKEVITSP